MMKYFLAVFLTFTSVTLSLKAQEYEMPMQQISISYFGEMITHEVIGTTEEDKELIVLENSGHNVLFRENIKFSQNLIDFVENIDNHAVLIGLSKK